MSALPTTPFGRLMLTFAHVATQMAASARSPDKVVHKWKVFNAICTARPRLRVSERALSVLNALVSFYPDTTLAGEDELIVFPSHEKLCLRTHGMPASTLRRHLAVLVDPGPIVRRDSPNGKRYARKGRGGEIKLAFGFDLSPHVVRAEEFERLAREIEAEARAVSLQGRGLLSAGEPALLRPPRAWPRVGSVDLRPTIGTATNESEHFDRYAQSMGSEAAGS